LAASPNLIVIGAMKCGTTSLHLYLDQHPEIQMAVPKELNFFTWPERWEKGADWYESHFDPSFPVRGEVTPKYSKYPLTPDVPARMHALLPDAKLVYLVGDPLDRIVAHWVDWYANEVDLAPDSINARSASRPLGEVLCDFADPAHPYVSPSRYATQLDRYLRFYRPTQILVVDQEELRARRGAALAEVFGFLGVDPHFRSERFDSILNRSAEKARPRPAYSAIRRRALTAGLKRMPRRWRAPVAGPLGRLASDRVERPTISPSEFPGLYELLGAEADRLRELTGKRFADWRV
jgi:hypothetical protein